MTTAHRDTNERLPAEQVKRPLGVPALMPPEQISLQCTLSHLAHCSRQCRLVLPYLSRESICTVCYPVEAYDRIFAAPLRICRTKLSTMVRRSISTTRPLLGTIKPWKTSHTRIRTIVKVIKPSTGIQQGTLNIHTLKTKSMMLWEVVMMLNRRRRECA